MNGFEPRDWKREAPAVRTAHGQRPLLPDLAPGVKARALALGSVVLVHASVWAIALSTAHVLMPRRQIFAESISTLALVLLSCNLVLSTRARFLERGLDGLDKLFVTHRLIGLTVGVLVITHFGIVPKSVGYVASKPVGYTTLALLLTVIFIASAPRFPWRGLVPMRYDTWKSTHRFNGFIVAAAVTHSLLAHTYVRRVPLLAGYVYTVAAIGLLAYVYRETLFARVGPFRRCTVKQYTGLGSGVLEVTLTSAAGPYLRKAGQFSFVSFAAGPSEEQHPFTISSGPGADVRFSIKASGDFTARLASGVPTDSAARIEGPYGTFGYRRGRRRQLWLAGGIGITPFLAMAADLDPDREVILLWSVRDRNEAVYAEELEDLGREKRGLTVVIHPTSELGHVDPAALGLVTAPLETSAFVCGPVPMRLAMTRQLRALGIPRSEIYFEEFRLR
jgi:predicted ferric reductase